MPDRVARREARFRRVTDIPGYDAHVATCSRTPRCVRPRPRPRLPVGALADASTGPGNVTAQDVSIPAPHFPAEILNNFDRRSRDRTCNSVRVNARDSDATQAIALTCDDERHPGARAASARSPLLSDDSSRNVMASEAVIGTPNKPEGQGRRPHWRSAKLMLRWLARLMQPPPWAVSTWSLSLQRSLKHGGLLARATS